MTLEETLAEVDKFFSDLEESKGDIYEMYILNDFDRPVVLCKIMGKFETDGVTMYEIRTLPGGQKARLVTFDKRKLMK